MPKIAAVALIVAVWLIAAPGVASAQMCNATGFPQHDMAGVYVSPEARMRVEIFACGGTYIQWENLYGTHYATYGSTNRLPVGGIAATGVLPDPAAGTYLDGSHRIGFKPGSPGHIEVITLGVYDESVRVYTLRKIG